MLVSERASEGSQPNEIAALATRLRSEGVAVTDLTDSNPTRHGLTDPAALDAIARAASRSSRYEPESKGPRVARAALADRFGGEPDDYWLTASTSEAYSWLFHLVADPGDTVAVPAPGYPLLEPLAALADIRTFPYGWFYVHPHGWSLDTAGLADAMTDEDRSAGADGSAAAFPRTVRALVAVNPGNPTGAYIDAPARDAMVEACDRSGAALIADEVFAGFPLDAAETCAATPDPESCRHLPPASTVVDGKSALFQRQASTQGVSIEPVVGGARIGASTAGRTMADGVGAAVSAMADGVGAAAWTMAAGVGAAVSAMADGVGAAAWTMAAVRLGGEDRVLTFALDGLSKLLAAPQLKLGWIRVSGPADQRAQVEGALDRIADTYLSVGTPVALALPELLDLAGDAIGRIRVRLQTNLAAARAIFDADAYRVRRCDGGWTVLLDVPRAAADDDLALRLLRDHHLAVHPGWFYDSPDSGLLALSLLPRPEEFARNCQALCSAIG